MAELLRKSQAKGLSYCNQKRTLEWFSYVIEMISVACLTRIQVIETLGEMITIASERVLQGADCIPLPMDVEVFHSDLPLATPLISKAHLLEEETVVEEDLESESEEEERFGEEGLLKEGNEESLKGEEEELPEIPGEGDSQVTCNKNLEEFIFIIEQIYCLLLNDFVFEALRSTLSDPPQIIPVVLSEQLNVPKEFKPPEVQVVKAKHDDGKDLNTSKSKKGNTKGKKKKQKEEPTRRVPSFLLHPTKEEIEQMKIEEQRQKEKDKYIFPLTAAADDAFFNRIYPPSPKHKNDVVGKEANKPSKKKGGKKK